LRRDDTAAAPLPSDLLRAHPGLPPFTGLTADSRAVGPGFLFAALPGAKADGRAFIADAVARGAVAVLAPDGTDWPEGIPARPLLTVADPRRMLALFAAEFHAAQPATVVAVTGTNGKTSTVDFLRQIWRLDGLRAASLGTLGLVADDQYLALRAQETAAGQHPLHQGGAGQGLQHLGQVALHASALPGGQHGNGEHQRDGQLGRNLVGAHGSSLTGAVHQQTTKMVV
jgi:UDP-N-acetylmuramoyl-L-alanyl-D-glutamate--2,6-diaminopimelate ligase